MPSVVRINSSDAQPVQADATEPLPLKKTAAKPETEESESKTAAKRTTTTHRTKKDEPQS